jgi:hypothetical protein
LAAGTLPSGLGLLSNGTISGIPSSQGTANFTVRVTDSVFATATKSFTIVVASRPTLSIFGGHPEFRVKKDAWLLMLAASSFPNTPFDICAQINGGSVSCSHYSYYQTDQYGNWSLSGYFERQTGNWQEWARFPDGTTSTSVFFTVIDWAELSINNAVFHPDDPWTLTLTSSIPYTRFRIWVKVDNGSWSPTGWYPATDGNGNPTSALTGTIPWQQAGTWYEYVEFENLSTTSNTIMFMVLSQ